MTKQDTRDRSTVQVVGGWAQCPVCRRNRRLARVLPETEGKNIAWFCKDCKQEIIVDIERGQSVERRSP